MSASPARVALIGANGFGAVHRRNLERLDRLGRAALVAVAEPAPLPAGTLADSVHVYRDLASLLDAESDLDVVIVSTPLHTHFELAEQVLASGADLYLEKPPVTSLEQLDRLRETATREQRLVQVGFQSLGSRAIPWLRSAVKRGDLGEVRAITAVGSWTRPLSYFTRSPWAGKRALDGVDVVDGVATNALSHAIVTAMRVSGVRRARDIERVDLDLFRANDTESDDTTVVRVHRRSPEPNLTCALTLCGPEEAEPYVTVHGSKETATFSYVLDEVRVVDATGEHLEHFGRDDLLENLLDARGGRGDLLSALADTEAYMTVLEAVRTSPPPRLIPSEYVDRFGAAGDERLIVRGIERDVVRAAAAEATFSELGLPWAVGDASDGDASDDVARTPGIAIGDRVVALSRDGSDRAASLSPRPYLHPVRTLHGVDLTDHLPLDHPWQLGASVAIPVVAPVGRARSKRSATNFWGGPDYDSESGAYAWGGAHGSIDLVTSAAGPDWVKQELTWRAPGGSELLRERRAWHADEVDEGTWRLRLRFALHAQDAAVALASPAALGREGAGYGGFYWRFARCERVDVRTRDAKGEKAVNGSRAPWLLWTAQFAGSPASVLFTAPSESEDPWFVRVDDYQGVGSALAWADALTAGREAPVVRTLSMYVSDGILTPADADRLFQLESRQRSA